MVSRFAGTFRHVPCSTVPDVTGAHSIFCSRSVFCNAARTRRNDDESRYPHELISPVHPSKNSYATSILINERIMMEIRSTKLNIYYFCTRLSFCTSRSRDIMQLFTTCPIGITTFAIVLCSSSLYQEDLRKNWSLGWIRNEGQLWIQRLRPGMQIIV